jgi:hypothetical protein
MSVAWLSLLLKPEAFYVFVLKSLSWPEQGGTCDARYKAFFSRPQNIENFFYYLWQKQSFISPIKMFAT